MKYVLGLLLTVLISGPVLAQRYPPPQHPQHPPQQPRPQPPRPPQYPQNHKACACFELERRIQGMETVLYRGQPHPNEVRQIQYEIYQAKGYYNSVNFNRDREGLQNQKCSGGNMAINNSWVRWQPWLAHYGLDTGSRCY